MEKSGGSRLMKMQARFQQKQLEEREMKIASLYEAQQARALDRVRHSPNKSLSNSTANSPPQAPVHPGKVRQMFEERRTKAGIDKSYPLRPIQNTERTTTRKPVSNGYNKVNTTSPGPTKASSTSLRVVEKKTTASRTTVVRKQQQKVENIVNGSGDLNHNHVPDFNAVKRNTHSQSNGQISIDELDRPDGYLLENETFPDALAPAATPRSPPPKEPKRPPRSPNKTRSQPQPQPVAPPRRATSDNAVSPRKAKGAMQCPANPVPKSVIAANNQRVTKRSSATSGTNAANGVAVPGEPCAVCGRKFAPDRLAKHEEICRKANNKKPRKPFDALKHRLAGTEAEPFIKQLRKESKAVVGKPLNSTWRQKHEEFIQAIRAAKQVQAHINAGGKLSDLPPPPPSENPDYVPCPHCGRRFNQAAAERHIPKCANYQFNKTKPNVSKKR